MPVADTRLAIVITACTFARFRSFILYKPNQGINPTTLEGRIYADDE
jgi:hypothetical protein